MEEAKLASAPTTDRLARSIVRIFATSESSEPQFLGSAFFITPTLALTARHVTEKHDAKNLRLQLGWRGVFFATVRKVVTDPDLSFDIALLEVGLENSAPVDALVSVGSPIPLLTNSQLRIAGYADAHSAIEFRPATVTGLDGIAEATIIDPPPGPGMSGGPALSPDGQLRGIIWARNMDQGRGYCTPVTSIRSFLENQSVEPGGAPASSLEYPALYEDSERLEKAREALIRWRADYAEKRTHFAALARQAEMFQREKGEYSEVVAIDLLDEAGALSEAFISIPIRQIKFAQPYGLSVHHAVFAGVATSIVLSQLKLLELQQDNLEMQRDSYLFESAKRIFESAIGMLDFLPDRLPQGFIDPTEKFDALKADSDKLFVGGLSNSAIGLFERGENVTEIYEFVGRPLPVRIDCCVRLEDGSVEVLGTDFQFRYRWQGRMPRPIMQYPHEHLLFLEYVDRSVGASPIAIDESGRVFEMFLDGSTGLIAEASSAPLARSAIMRETGRATRMILHRVTTSGLIITVDVQSGAVLAEVSGESLWHDHDFGGVISLSRWNTRLMYRTVLGFPALVVLTQDPTWSRVGFFDPLSLTPIRPAISLGGRLADIEVINSRTLIASHWGVSVGAPALSRYLLSEDCELPVSVVNNSTSFKLDVDSFVAFQDGEVVASIMSLADGNSNELYSVEEGAHQMIKLDCSLHDLKCLD